MVHVVVINGCGGVGKDTFVNCCKNYCSIITPDNKTHIFRIVNYSTVDKVKEIAKQLGWDGKKSEKDRKFLSDLKELTSEYNDFSYNETVRMIKDEYQETTDDQYINNRSVIDKIIFIHCREPKDIQKIVDFCKTYFGNDDSVKAYTLLIRSNRVEKITSNMADANVENYTYDYIIDNDSDIVYLKERAKNFLESLILSDDNHDNAFIFFDFILKFKNKCDNSIAGDISITEFALAKQADIINRIYNLLDNVPDNPMSATIQNSILNIFMDLCVYDIDTLKRHKKEWDLKH